MKMFVHLRMHKDFTIIDMKTSVREAFRLLNSSDVGALPIIADGALKGVVTRRKLEARVTDLLMAGIITDFDDVVYPLVEGKLVTLSPEAIIEEAAHLMAKHDLDALPIVESDDTLVGVIAAKDVFNSFGEMLGLNTTGSRLTIRVEDKTGKLAEITLAISKYGVGIVSVAAYKIVEGYRDVVLRINTDNPQDIVADLRGQGYKVVHVCQVWY